MKSRFKQAPSKKITAIVLSAVAIALLVTTVTFAWFRNTMEVPGVSMNTGSFEYQFVGYHKDSASNSLIADFAYSTEDGVTGFDKESQSGFNPISDSDVYNALGTVTDTGNISGSEIAIGKPGEIYYVVRKLPNSIDLDVSIRLNASLSKLKDFSGASDAAADASVTDPEIVGGLWYSVDNITGSQESLEAIKAYIADSENYKDENGYSVTREEQYFPNIRNEVVNNEIYDVDNFWCFRLCYGMKDGANSDAFVSKTVNFFATLCVAQKGGLPDAETSNQYIVTTLNQFKDALLKYIPNDTIIIQGNIVYEGDLLINRPLKLKITSGSLTVKGNVRYTYTSKGNFELDISAGNFKILKMDTVDAGGNFYLDIPNSNIEIHGRNLLGAGAADIYVENQFSIDVNYDEETTSGLILSNARICKLDDTLQTIHMRQTSKLVVGQGTEIGAVDVITDADANLSAIRLAIVNYGTIGKIGLRSMLYIQNQPHPNPRIFIDNYGKIEDPIVLPPWAAKWYPDVEGDITKSNTRIIHEQGAGRMTVESLGQKFISDGSGVAERDHIEYMIKETLIDKLNPEGTDIVIHYMENTLFDVRDENGEIIPGITTIRKLIEYYQDRPAEEEDFQIAASNQITSLKIICYTGYALTEEDYYYIRDNMPALEIIDLSEASSAEKVAGDGKGGSVPTEAFKNLANLHTLSLPKTDCIWGANLFVGTKVEEITLPTRLNEIDPYSLTGIKFVHIGNKADLIISSMPNFIDDIMANRVYVFCADDATRDALIEAIEQRSGAIQHFKEKTMLVDNYDANSAKYRGAKLKEAEMKMISTIFLDGTRYGNYYLVLHDNTCEVITYIDSVNAQGVRVTFDAVKEQAGYTVDDVYYAFDFKTFTLGQENYTVTRYDDFAFFDRNLTGFDTLAFHENLFSIGDGAFYSATLPTTVDLGGCTSLGHGAFYSGTGARTISALRLDTIGYLACGNLGSTLKWINMPRLSWCYGSPFDDFNSSTRPVRLDIGLVRTAEDALDKTGTGLDTLFGNSGNIGNSNAFIYTAYLDTAVDRVVDFCEVANFYAYFVNEDYVSVLVNSGYGSSFVKSLGSYTAEDVRFVADSVQEFGAFAYIPHEDGQSYKLIRCIRGTTIDGYADGIDGVYTIPAYTDPETGITTTEVGASSFHYQFLENVDTLTFADSYRIIGNSAFYGYNTSKRYAKIDLNNVTTIGEGAFKDNKFVASVVGEHVTQIAKQTFLNCSNLRSLSLPYVAGNCESAFQGCTLLEIAAVGPVSGSNIFLNCPALHTVFVNVTGFDPTGVVTAYFCGNSGAKVNFDVISVGGVFSWEMTSNSPNRNNDSNPDNDVADPYNMIVIDADIDSIIFADWDEDKAIKATVPISASGTTKDYYIPMPTYMFAENEDGFTIQLAFDMEDITGDTYVIPDRLYKVPGSTQTTIFAKQTDEYSTVYSDGYTGYGGGKTVVAIEDNIFDGKINVGTVQFPRGLMSIGRNAFRGCTFRNGLSIEGHGTGLVIEESAFSGAITSSLTITNATEIGKEAFLEIKNVDEFGLDIPLTSISLGNKLEFIGESAFEGAQTASISTSHVSYSPILMTISENAFLGVTNSGLDINVDFAGAVADFGERSFLGMKIGDLTAPNTVRVAGNAFGGASFTGTIDFSEGVPVGLLNAGVQTIEAGAFNSCDINAIKLGKNAVVGGSKTEATTDAGTQTTIFGAFDDCTIGEFYFSDDDAVSPGAWAFVDCGFTKIDLGAMESIATGLAEGEYCFYDCADLGQVYFTNVTTIAPFVNTDSAKVIITPVNLCGAEHNVGVNFMQNAFRNMNIQTGITISEGSTVGLASFRNSTINGDLVVGDSISIAGSGDYASSNRDYGEGAFRGTTVTGSATFGDNVSFNANAFYGSAIKGGPATFGESNTFGVGSFSSVSFGSSLIVGENARYSGGSQFRSSKIGGDLSIASGFSFGDSTFRGVAIHGKTTINSGTFGNTAFIYSGFDGDIETIGSVKFGNNAFNSVRLGTADNFINISFSAGTTVGGSFMSSSSGSSGSLHCNITLEDGIALSASDLFSANIAGTVSVGTLTVNNMRTCGGLFGSCNSVASRNYRVNKVLVRSSCTEIPAYLFASAKFGTIEFENGNPITVGDKAFLHARIDTIVNMDRVTQIGNQAFSVVCEHGHVTDAVTSVGSGMDLSNVTAIGANAFENFVFTSPIDISSTQTIATKAFCGSTIPGDITITDTVTTLASGAFQNAIIDTVTFMNSPVIEADTFKGSDIDVLTFMVGGDIKAEAFAEGTYGTVKLGSVTSIGGSYTAATDDAAAVVTGAFRGASIGTLDFQNACYIVSDDIPQPIANGAFANARIAYLNFEGRARALIGDSLDNSTDLAFVAGAYSPFSGARITRLNLNDVTSIGYGYFANLSIDRVDAINNDVELMPWSFSGTSVLDGSLIFNGTVTMNSYVTCGPLNIPSGNLEFNGALVAAGGYNHLNIGGDVVMNNISGNGLTGETNAFISGNVDEGDKSIIVGDLIIKNTETLSCGFRQLEVGGLIFENVKNITQNFGFYGIKIKNRVDLGCIENTGERSFYTATFPANTTLNLSNALTVGTYSFSSSKNIVAINAPVLTSVSGYTFNSINTLEEIRMPSLVSTSNQYCFANNSKLSYVFVPMLRNIVPACFRNCSSLKRVEFPSLQKIDGEAFSGCSKLEEIVIGDQFSTMVNKVAFPNNLKRLILKTPLNYDATTGNIGITGNLKLPAGAKLLVPYELKADYDAYFGTDSAKTLWSNITKDQIDTIQFILSDGTGVTYLAELLYGNKIEIVDIIDTTNALSNASYTFPSTLVDGDTTYTVVSIAGAAMQRIPSTVTTIGLPSTLEYINFSGIDLHINVQAYSIENNSFYQVIDGVLYTADGKTLVMYPTGRTADFIVPETVEYIGAYAFAGNQGIGTITFTDNVTISDGAFANCYELEKIVFEANATDVRFIGRNTVSGCMLEGDNKLRIQMFCGSYPKVLYDSQIYDLIELVNAGA